MRTSLPVARRSLFVVGLIFCAALSASAQYSILYTFPTGSDINAYPSSALVGNSQGNLLYGTTGRSIEEPGGVFELMANGSNIWTESFYGGFGGDNGISPVGANRMGVVFELQQ